MANNPTDDRRTSIRREATLPFLWRTLSESASLADACRALGLPDTMALQTRLAELDEEFQQLRSTVGDSATAEALRVLDGKLSVLEEILLGQMPEPPAQPLALSADGVGFRSAQELTTGTTIAVHIVLPVSQHVVCRARVNRCEGVDRGYLVGAQFMGLEGPAARRLTRFAISRERAEE